MNVCPCATHCPQSPHHTVSCCHEQYCDCWCHSIIGPHHKAIVSKATNEQRDAAKQAYAEHRRVCADVGIAPSDFGVFFAEWLECERNEERSPAKTAQGSNADAYQSRNYEKMFDGKRGWE
jgi:hypothetical protein